jgi:putative transposase
MHLAVNMLIQWQQSTNQWEDEQGKTCIERVLCMNECASHVMVIDIDHHNKQAWPTLKPCADLLQGLESGMAREVHNDPYSYIYRDDGVIKQKDKDIRDAAWKLIEGIVNGSRGHMLTRALLTPLISEATKKLTKKTKKNLYIYLRYFWQGGQVKNALLPRYQYCGGRGKERSEPGKNPKRTRQSKTPANDVPARFIVTEEVKGQFLWGTHEYYEDQHKTLAETHFKICWTYYTYLDWDEKTNQQVRMFLPENERPTFRQYRYWFYKYMGRNQERSLIARAGLTTFNQQMRPLSGSERDGVLGPGSMFYYDAVIPDIYLVSRLNRAHIIGRPVVHVVIDLFSGIIAGFSVVLEGPNWVGAMLCFEHMCLKKFELYKDYGLGIREEDWPSYHIPQWITGDRGELFWKDIEIFAQTFHVQISNTPPFRPDWKAIIERYFRILQDELISWIPGHIPQVPRRSGKDYRLDARLTVDEFRMLLVAEILSYNRSHPITTKHWDAEMFTTGLKPHPRNVWSWGLQHRNGYLQTADQDAVRLSLLRKDKASIQPDGLHFDGARYTCDRAIVNGWFVRQQERRNRDLAEQQKFNELSEAERGRYLPIRHDPRTRDVIYLVLDQGKTLEPCTLIDPDKIRFEGADWYDLDDFLAMERRAGREREPAQWQERLTTQDFQEGVIEEAERKTEQALNGVSKAERLRHQGTHRAEENIRDHQQNPWRPPQPPRPLQTNSVALDAATKRRLEYLRESTE